MILCIPGLLLPRGWFNVHSVIFKYYYLVAASNLIMRGVGGLENAQACAVIEDNAANTLDEREDIVKSGTK